MVLACQISAITAQDLLFGPTLRRFPDLKVALSEGGIGWIPFYFDRIDRHYWNQEWLHGEDDFGGKNPSQVFREHILACYITDPSGLLLRDRIGMDIIAWECDYPHTDTTWPESPEFAWKEFQERAAPTRRSTRSRGRTPAGSSTGTRSSTRPKDRPRSAPSGPSPTDVDVTRRPRAEWEGERGRRHRRVLIHPRRNGDPEHPTVETSTGPGDQAGTRTRRRNQPRLRRTSVTGRRT